MLERHDRPDPDAILREIRRQEAKVGQLKIFFAYAAGAGKTYAMLDEAQELYRQGRDVLVGYVEPHVRPETAQLLAGLPELPCKTIQYRNMEMKEFDLDAALERKPELILVDELAHTNAAGSRNKKRYQDVEELLKAGINVFTTINVQHIESLNDMVAGITKVNVQETVPDYIFDRADRVKLIDIDPDELLNRFSEGKIYQPRQAETAVKNFFVQDNLRLLREIAMRKAADRVSSENQTERSSVERLGHIKLMVCFGSSPSSAKCIRWAARAAEAFHIPLVAVCIELVGSAPLDNEQKRTLKKNTDLAEKLGAEVVFLTGEDLAKTIADYAKMSGTTNIVIGKNRDVRTWRNLFQEDLENRLIELLPSVEVHIISEGNRRRFLPRPKKFKLGASFSWGDCIKMIFILAIATMISIELERWDIGDQNTGMIYILSVLLISRVTEGYLYGILASVLSVLTFNFFFTEPQFTFHISDASYSITFGIMFLAALITSALTGRIKTQAQVAVEREIRTDALHEINKRLLMARGLPNIVSLTNSYIVSLFGRSVIFYTADPMEGSNGTFLQSTEEEDSSFMNSTSERAVAHWVFINEKPAGSGTDTLMGAGCFYMPIISQGQTLGVIGVSCVKNKLGPEKRFFLQMMISLIAMALERQRLSDNQRSLLVETEKEKMRGNLLRAISHDLRTPLLGILDASSKILETPTGSDPEDYRKLATHIKEDSQWLVRMVDNLLSVTRIREGKLNMTKTMELAEKIVDESISRIHKRFSQRQISVHISEEALFVPMDSTLITQVLINLLENAVKNSPEESLIEVAVHKKGKLALFEVLDRGSGIPEEKLPYLFEHNFLEAKKTSRDYEEGMGLGLSISTSIIKAHQGEISAANRTGGGAVFRFTLPLGRS